MKSCRLTFAFVLVVSCLFGGRANAEAYLVDDELHQSVLHDFSWAVSSISTNPDPQHVISFKEHAQPHVYVATNPLLLAAYTEVIGPSPSGQCTLVIHTLNLGGGGSIENADIRSASSWDDMGKVWNCSISNLFVSGRRVLEGVRNCTIAGPSTWGVSATDTEFNDCEILQASLHGTNIVLRDCVLTNAAVRAANTELYDSIVRGGEVDGIRLARDSDMDNVCIRGQECRLASNRLWRVMLSGSNIVVEYNRVFRNGEDAGNYARGGNPVVLITNSFGLAFEDAADVTICGNHIGFDGDPATVCSNQEYGIALLGARNVMIGGTNSAERNYIGGNRTAGIYAAHGDPWEGNASNVNISIMNNFIGLAVDGVTPIPNGCGIRFAPSWSDNRWTVSGARIGAPGMGNVISGNMGDGISLQGHCSNVVIKANRIGMVWNSTTSAGNGANGVYVSGYSDDYPASGVVIGADWGETNELAGNVIAGNAGHGVQTGGGAIGLRMAGNWIGAAPDAGADNGAKAVPNDGWGVDVAGGRFNQIGLTGTFANVIPGNEQGGMRVGWAEQNTICNNFIGTGPAGQGDIPNGGDGICLGDGASFNDVGGSLATSANYIGGNIGWGVNMPAMTVFGASRNNIFGNWIGIAPDGMTYSVNKQGGVQMGGLMENRLGGAGDGEGNIVDGMVGVHMHGNAALGLGQRNMADGNVIGFNPFSSFVSTTMVTGIEIGNCLDSDIGTFRGNLIGGARLAGIRVANTPENREEATGHYIRNNVIGCATNALGMTVTNGGYGIKLEFAGENTIGAEDKPNFIAGNLAGIISLESLDCEFVGNVIGLDPAGRMIGNRGEGVSFSLDEGFIFGGTAEGQYNVIGGSASNAMSVCSASSGQVLGNLIGLAPDGSPATNFGHGLLLIASTNIVVGQGFGQAPVIGGNAGDGLCIIGSVPSAPGQTSTVIGCMIGMNMRGDAAVPNGGAGVRLVNTASNRIGVALDGRGNFIGGNLGDGISIEGPCSQGNTVMGNMIGFATNMSPVGNQGHGIRLTDAPGNIIGGLIVSNGNFIGNSGGCGIVLEGEYARQNVLMGNCVGTTLQGGNHSNQYDGIRLVGIPAFNLVGFTNEGFGNLIVHNGGSGVAVHDCSDFLVAGNRIGVSWDKTNSLGNAFCGILFTNSRLAKIINNDIGGNGDAGIRLEGPDSDQNQIINNRIGTSAINGHDLANGGDGIYLRGGDRNRVVSENVIANNSGNGVAIWTGSRITVMGNRIYQNARQSIFLATNTPPATNPPNEGITAPVIMSATVSNQTISGMIIGKPSQLYLLDFFYAFQTNEHGAWAQIPLGTDAGMTGPDGIGGFSSVMSGWYPLITGVYVTVNMTETNTEFLSNSSEFSAPFLSDSAPPPQPIPVVAVAPAGPGSATVGENCEFVALYQPSNATPPINFLWTPAPHSGQGSAQAIFRFDTAGVWTVAVVAANFSGSATGNTGIAVTAAPVETGTVVGILHPDGAVADGTRWRLAGMQGTNWLASGASAGMNTGIYTQEFSVPEGWQAPAVTTVTVEANAATVFAATFAPAVIPPAPAWIQATSGTTARSVVVTWAMVNKASAYLLWRSGDSNRVHAQLLSDSLGSTSYRDGAVVATNQYWYWVGTTNALGLSATEAGPAAGWPRAASAGLGWFLLLQ